STLTTEPRRMPGRDDIEAAHQRVSRHIRRTPVLDVATGTFGVDVPLSLKLELLQVTGSFKPRGAFNRMLTADVGEAGVVAASGGNFGLAVGHAAHTLGFHAEIFVPATSPTAKIERVRASGADVTVVDGVYDDAAAAAAARRSETGAVWMHPYDQPEVVAGQGTIGLELSQQVPGVETVVVSVGGGGLIAGIASWFVSGVRIVAVEPDTSRCLGAALEAGEPIEVPVSGIAVDSLGARRVGDIAFQVASAHVDRCLTVSEDDIRQAQRAIWGELRLLAEPGGATALAALTSGAYRPEPEERVVVVVCGSNADPVPVIGH
ncbi:MAG TPA: threonine/serine dehydratase, partial [Actinomycetota bacterium]